MAGQLTGRCSFTSHVPSLAVAVFFIGFAITVVVGAVLRTDHGEANIQAVHESRSRPVAHGPGGTPRPQAGYRHAACDMALTAQGWQCLEGATGNPHTPSLPCCGLHRGP